jgi:molecular chaperone GrpE
VFRGERFILRPMHGESRSASEGPDTDAPVSESVESGAPASNPSGSEPGEAATEATEARAEAVRLKDALLRMAADFDNFRKRTRRELEDARRGGREDLLRGLLPVFDNLERAMQSAQRSSDVKAMTEGLGMVQRQFVDALGREGIARIATVGKPFDPGVHEAIQQVETAEHPPGTIIAEVQPGYTQGDRLLRAAMVVVARPKASDGEATDGPGEVN